MLKVHTLPYNPWQENTYLISADNGECIIIDPGCLADHEQQHLVQYLKENNLTPTKLWNTHLHLDHVFGNRFVCDTFNLSAVAHKGDEFWIEKTVEYAGSMGIEVKENPPAIGTYFEDGQELEFGGSIIKIIHVPGHSPGGVVLYAEKEGFAIAGDVLFRDSIGRADLPGGDYDTLISGIKAKLLTLPAEVAVYPGHGPSTTIGYEKENNMHLQ